MLFKFKDLVAKQHPPKMCTDPHTHVYLFVTVCVCVCVCVCVVFQSYYRNLTATHKQFNSFTKLEHGQTHQIFVVKQIFVLEAFLWKFFACVVFGNNISKETGLYKSSPTVQHRCTCLSCVTVMCRDLKD